MNWYYVEAGQQAGPVDDAQLSALVQSGKILADTLVWREGMANWQPYREVQPAGQGMTDAPPLIGLSSGTTTGAPEAVCAECGNIFPIGDMVRFGGAHVCANCKPIYVQKLSEGAPLQTGGLNYAGFWIRFAAVFLDGIIMWVVNMGVALIGGLSLGQAVGIEPNSKIVLQLTLALIQILIGITYEVVLIGKYGATVGKMACKIKVVTAEGGPVSYLRAFGRYFAKLLSAVTCLIGYIIAGFDDQKRALHDRICNTRVVYK